MPKYRVCRACHGKGKVDCWACEGTEDHPYADTASDPTGSYAAEHCPECVDGTEVCLDCNGDGGEMFE